MYYFWVGATVGVNSKLNAKVNGQHIPILSLVGLSAQLQQQQQSVRAKQQLFL